MSNIYVDKTFQVGDNEDSDYRYQLETVEGGSLVEFSYWERNKDGNLEKHKDSITFPAHFAPVLGKLLLEQFTED